jgi:hypothetical protein
MKVKTIEVAMSLTIPTGSHYGSVKPYAGLSAELEDGEDVNKAYEDLSAQCVALFLKETGKLSKWFKSFQEEGIDAAVANYLNNFEVIPEAKA